MNKQKALQWCVDNLKSWPKNTQETDEKPFGWVWFNGIDGAPHLYKQVGSTVRLTVTKDDWLTEHRQEVTAAQILEAGLGHMRDRAVTYDNESGERSMSATVEAFNAITGHQLTEEQGWHFMTLLKLVRSQQGAKKLDNYEDGAAYFGLAGEAAMRGES